MAWSKARAQERINKHLTSVPQGGVQVERFEEHYAQRTSARAEDARMGLRSSPIVRVPPSKAILVHGVHVYINLTDYHSVLVDATRETEARHKRALKFLHTHYSASDRVIVEYDAQRVDFHGPRLHAVIVTPPGSANEPERVKRALDFAQAMQRMIEVTGDKVLGGEFKTGVRIGIDTGMAVAVNSGRKDEQEPLFLGNPANYAAKLADGDDPGIFLSDRARLLLGLGALGSLRAQRSANYITFYAEVANAPTESLFGVTRSMSNQRVAALSEEVKATVEPQVRAAEFTFHRHQPPLSSIDYSKLAPSNTIHMQMASIFADIDGFTNYVQTSIDTGKVQELVSNLHVIRRELAAVLKEDFDGRKVRFIGDCIHGVLAEGTRDYTNEAGTVETSVLCAGAMRSSFELCQAMLPGIADLGLAIGIELGNTPISRIGTRGDLAVRCATSRAVSESERLQSELDGTQTALGSKAMAEAPAKVRHLFRPSGIVPRLTYQAATALVIAAPAVVAASGETSDFYPHASN